MSSQQNDNDDTILHNMVVAANIDLKPLMDCDNITDPEFDLLVETLTYKRYKEISNGE